jgi:hypothetical protein
MAAGMAWVIEPKTWLFHWFLYNELSEDLAAGTTWLN